MPALTAAIDTLPAALADELCSALYRCADATTQRAEVARLVAQHPAHAAILQQAAALWGDDGAAPDAVGPYLVREKLGSGGYGDVFRAEQQHRRIVPRPGGGAKGRRHRGIVR
ncbi:MAG: hypothetical protein FJ301_05150 [Planctomycetes bacterium]|nr:hypothetical protein [Planctomycetota bacterium]